MKRVNQDPAGIDAGQHGWEEDEGVEPGFEMSQIRPLMSAEDKQRALDEIMRVLRGERD